MTDQRCGWLAADLPEADKGETLGQADALAVLRETAPDVEWFYLSPAAAALRRGLLKVLGHWRSRLGTGRPRAGRAPGSCRIAAPSSLTRTAASPS